MATRAHGRKQKEGRWFLGCGFAIPGESLVLFAAYLDRNGHGAAPTSRSFSLRERVLLVWIVMEKANPSGPWRELASRRYGVVLLHRLRGILLFKLRLIAIPVAGCLITVGRCILIVLIAENREAISRLSLFVFCMATTTELQPAPMVYPVLR